MKVRANGGKYPTSEEEWARIRRNFRKGMGRRELAWRAACVVFNAMVILLMITIPGSGLFVAYPFAGPFLFFSAWAIGVLVTTWKIAEATEPRC